MFSTCRKRIFFVELFQVGGEVVGKGGFLFYFFGGEDIQRIERKKKKRKEKDGWIIT